ncbi:MAG: hypothetical protein Q4B28_07525 [bacterium]|nr:hypothetical protein [bacterium]
MSTEIRQQITSLLEQAKRFSSYEPSEEVNAYFIQLCAYAR